MTRSREGEKRVTLLLEWNREETTTSARLPRTRKTTDGRKRKWARDDGRKGRRNVSNTKREKTCIRGIYAKGETRSFGESERQDTDRSLRAGQRRLTRGRETLNGEKRGCHLKRERRAGVKPREGATGESG